MVAQPTTRRPLRVLHSRPSLLQCFVWHWKSIITSALVFIFIFACLVLAYWHLKGQADYFDLVYGKPRLSQLEAFVGHDEDGIPTRLLAVNQNRRVIIVEWRGGNPENRRLIYGPFLVGRDEDKTPITMRLLDVNGDRHNDLLISIKGEEIVYINDKGEFRPMTKAERPAVERAIREAAKK